MTHNHNYNLQKNGLAKKITSIGLSIALLATGAVSLKSCINNKKDKDLTNTTIEQTVPTGETLFLAEDFDINDKDAVRSRAEAIYEISEKSITVDEIEDMINLYNEEFNGITFDKDDDTAKSNYLQLLLTIDTEKLLNDNISDDIDKMNNNDISSVNEDWEIQAYMFLANGADKKEALELAKILNEHLDNIKNGDTEACKLTAKKYYDKIINLKQTELKSGSKTIIFEDIHTKSALFTSFLSQNQAAEIDLDFVTIAANKLAFDALSYLGVSQEQLMKDVIEKGMFIEQTPYGNNHFKEDASAAEKIAEKYPTTTNRSEGGKPVETQTSPAKTEGTTREEYEEDKVFGKDETHTNFVPGGQPVGDPEMVSEVISVPSETSEEFEEEPVVLNGQKYIYSVPSTTYRDANITAPVKTLR